MFAEVASFWLLLARRMPLPLPLYAFTAIPALRSADPFHRPVLV